MARPPGTFFRDRNDANHSQRHAERRDGAHGAGDGRAAGHVIFHAIHVERGFEEMPPRRNAFADQPEHGRCRAPDGS